MAKITGGSLRPALLAASEIMIMDNNAVMLNGQCIGFKVDDNESYLRELHGNPELENKRPKFSMESDENECNYGLASRVDK